MPRVLFVSKVSIDESSDAFRRFLIWNSSSENLGKPIPIRHLLECSILKSARKSMSEHKLACIAKGWNTSQLCVTQKVPIRTNFFSGVNGRVVNVV
jgi:hypothetical protein